MKQTDVWDRTLLSWNLQSVITDNTAQHRIWCKAFHLRSFNLIESHLSQLSRSNGLSVWFLQSVEVSWMETLYTHWYYNYMILPPYEFTIIWYWGLFINNVLHWGSQGGYLQRLYNYDTEGMSKDDEWQWHHLYKESVQ